MCGLFVVPKKSRQLSAKKTESVLTEMLSAKDVHKFAAMWKREYGEQLTDDEAKERAERLVHFVLLMQSMGS